MFDMDAAQAAKARRWREVWRPTPSPTPTRSQTGADRRPTWQGVLLGACALGLAAAVHAEAALSLDEVQRLALQRSQAVVAQRAAGQAALQRAEAASRRPDPVMRLGLDNVPIEGGLDSLLTREPTTARSIGLSQAWPSAAKRAARGRVFQQDAELAAAAATLEARSLARQSGLAWFSLRAERQRLLLVAAQRSEATLLHQAAEAAYRAGRGAQADVFAARSALARLDDRQLLVQQGEEVATTALLRWTGPVDALALAPAPPLTALALAETPVDQLPDADPELLLSAARQRVAEAAVGAAREDRHADWSVDLRFQQRGPRFDNMVSLGISIPLRWGADTTQDRDLAARLAQQQEAAARTEETRRARQAELAAWRQRWRSGLARLHLLDTALRPLAQARVEAALGAYRAGSGTLVTVLEARQAELALQLDRVQLELDTASDWVRLDALAPRFDLQPSAPTPATTSTPPEISP